MKNLLIFLLGVVGCVGTFWLWNTSSLTSDEGLSPSSFSKVEDTEPSASVELAAPDEDEPNRQAEESSTDSEEQENPEELPVKKPVPSNLREWLARKRPDAVGDLTDEQIAALESLDLRGAEITDADLIWIAQFKNLKDLSLYGNPITDAGLSHLSSLLKLQNINLRGTQVTGSGLAFLPTQSLERLHLCNSAITRADLQSTPPMPALKTLKLNFLGFEDDMVESINVYPNLRHLEIDRSKITDSGLARLLELNPGLTRIELRNTQVTPEGLSLIKQSYPNCELITQ